MKVICIANQKGGVGKSTTAFAIGACLAEKGKRVLFVDLDQQGNLTFNAGVKRSRTNGSVVVLQSPASIVNEIVPVPTVEGASILPSSPSLAGMDLFLTETGKEYRLKEGLEFVADRFDYVVIDTPPSLGILTVNAFTASDSLVVPAHTEVSSIHGISQLSETVNAVRRYCNPSLVFEGIVLTSFNSRLVIARDLSDVISSTAESIGTKKFNTVIPECNAVREAEALQRTIFKHAPDSTASTAYRSLVSEIIKE